MCNYALFNILLAFITGILAIIFLCRKKDVDLTPVQRRRVRMAKSISVEIGLVSCLVCLFSKHMELWTKFVDRWSLIMFILFLGAILSAYYVDRRCHGKQGID